MTQEFNQVEKEFLTNNRVLPPATLAKSLNTTAKRVKAFLETLPKTKSNIDNVMGTIKDKNDKPRGTVMTPAASEIADKHRASRKKNLIDPSCIHRCKE